MVRLSPTADPAIEAVVSALARVARPELVLLFGSRAAGTSRPDSDYDLLVIVADDANRERDQRLCWDAVRDAAISADVIVRTASEYRRQQHDPGYIDWLVAREGVVLYASGALAQRSPAPRVREAPAGFELWRRRADADFRTAELAAGAAPPVADAACFHSHAAIEKLLKAEIVRLGVYPPRTHDLLKLLDMQPTRLRDDANLRAACAALQRLDPGSRYPDQPMPRSDDADSAIKAGRLARAFFPA